MLAERAAVHEGQQATLVLLPGLDGTGIFFEPLQAALPPWIGTRVLSYPQDGRSVYPQLLEHAERELAGLSRFAVLGWSFGGPLALMLAARRPAAVSAVVLCNTFVTSPRPGLAPFSAVVRTPVVAAVRALRRTRLLMPGTGPALRAAKARTWREVHAGALAARARAALHVDARAALAGCSAPMLCLSASHDEVVPAANLHRLRQLAPRMEIAEIPGPHMVLFANPRPAAARIAAFLAAAGSEPARGP